MGFPTPRRPPHTDPSQPRLTFKQERYTENTGIWTTLYVQTPVVRQGGTLCLPIAYSLPSTIPILQSTNSAMCHWFSTYMLHASSAPRQNSPGTDVASALIFLTPLCPWTTLSDSVLQGLMTEVVRCIPNPEKSQALPAVRQHPPHLLFPALALALLPRGSSGWAWQEASARLHTSTSSRPSLHSPSPIPEKGGSLEVNHQSFIFRAGKKRGRHCSTTEFCKAFEILAVVSETDSDICILCVSSITFEEWIRLSKALSSEI